MNLFNDRQGQILLAIWFIVTVAAAFKLLN
jgi:hypothetical protein